MADDSLLGAPIELEIDGQRVKGKVTAVHPDRLEVSVRLSHTARELIGQPARLKLADGRSLDFDLGGEAHFSRLTLEVPLAAERERERASDDDERRRYFRLGVNLDVEVLEDAGSGKEYVRAHGTTVNLSGGGMLVDLDRPLISGVHTFRVHMPTETLVVDGRVVKTFKGPQIRTAVEFLHMPEAERSKVIRFIFAKMRNVKEGVSEEKKQRKKDQEPPRYWLRRLKFYQPPKIRYW